MAKEKTLIDVRDAIINHMEDNGQNLTWLAKKTDIPYGTIISCLSRKLFSLSEENLDKINDALGTSFKLG